MIRLLWVGVLLLCFSTVATGAQRMITGVITDSLTVYSAEGRNLGVERGVTDQEIFGTRVLATTPQKLIKVQFRGKEMYLRSAQLKFNMALVKGDKEPIQPTGRSEANRPITSGMGSDDVQ